MRLFIKSKKDRNSCCSLNLDELIIKDEDNKINECGCTECIEGKHNQEETCSTENEKENNLIIKILGSGCKNCITLHENVISALKFLNLSGNVIKVTDLAEITSYGVMSTPALVINEKVVSYGKVLKPFDIVKMIERETN